MSLGSFVKKVAQYGSTAGGGTLLGGGIGLVGGILANQASAKSTREQMDFQRYMSNTSHQREVADLRAAGLNPILSANSGASSPSGASYTAANVGDVAVSSGLGAARTGQDIKLSRANVKVADQNVLNLIENNRLIRAQTEAAGASAEAASAQAAKTRAETLGTGMENMLKMYSIPAAKIAAEITQNPKYKGWKETDLEYGTEWGRIIKALEGIGLNPVNSARSAIEGAGNRLKVIPAPADMVNRPWYDPRRYFNIRRKEQ